jgi:predicted alpha/beta-hydrolase family hydrolase
VPAPEPKRRVTRSSTKAGTASVEGPTVGSSKAEHAKPKKERVSKSKRSTSKKDAKSEAAPPSEQPAADTTLTPHNVTTLTITHAVMKKPLQCHQYTPKSTPSETSPILIFTHGAGGTLSTDAVVNFCTGFSTSLSILALQGSMNLKVRTKSFHACIDKMRSKDEGSTKSLLLGGRSMGARAAVIAATEYLKEPDNQGEKLSMRLVLVSYPLQGPKDVRDQILLDLPESVSVLFVIGERDAMCPLGLLNATRAQMTAKSQLVVVKGTDHGMHVKPASLEKELGEETGRVASEWVEGRLEEDMVYIGEQKG